MIPVYQLGDQLEFPSVNRASPDGLLALGGDLSPDRLTLAYSSGVFPWPHADLPLMWFAPDPRMVLPLRDLRVSRSLRARLRRGDFEVRFDTAFRKVVESCARVPRAGQDGTWINPTMVDAYCRLHRLGLAHSAEAWQDGELVGGLYGVSLGGGFFGESMFTRTTDASKVAFATLVRHLDASGFRFVDCQMHTEHLARFGARLWSRARYMETLRASLALPTQRGRWVAERGVLRAQGFVRASSPLSTMPAAGAASRRAPLSLSGA
jgi:leucyl/phenylalanyl-tRNA--protein transferase